MMKPATKATPAFVNVIALPADRAMAAGETRRPRVSTICVALIDRLQAVKTAFEARFSCRPRGSEGRAYDTILSMAGVIPAEAAARVLGFA